MESETGTSLLLYPSKVDIKNYVSFCKFPGTDTKNAAKSVFSLCRVFYKVSPRMDLVA